MAKEKRSPEGIDLIFIFSTSNEIIPDEYIFNRNRILIQENNLLGYDSI